jgi:hypothetical protein
MEENNHEEDKDDEVDEEGEMDYDESESEDSSHTQPDEAKALEDALAGGEIEEPADGWHNIDDEMGNDEVDGDKEEDDLDKEDRNEEEMMWEVRDNTPVSFHDCSSTTKGGMGDNGGTGQGHGLLVDEQEDDEDGDNQGMVDGDDQTGGEEIDMLSAADEYVASVPPFLCFILQSDTLDQTCWRF